VTAIEDRLRAAFHADAETIAHPPPCPGPASFRPAGQLTHRRIWIPLAAAASVAAVIVGAAVIAPRMQAHRDHGAARTGQSPKFLAAIELRSGTDLDIVSAATGKITDQVARPTRDDRFLVVATANSDRAFVAAAFDPSRCVTSFYSFGLTPTGTVTRFQPYARPLTGTMTIALAVSANLRVLAYATQPCHFSPHGDAYGLGLTNSTGHGRGYTRRWTFSHGEPYSLSLTASGRLAGFMSTPAVPKPGDTTASEWVLPTNSPAGPVQRYYRRAVSPRSQTGSPTCVLSRSGSDTFCATPARLASYRTSSGREIGVLRTFPDRHGVAPTLSLSASGQYLLISFLGTGQPGHPVYGLDLATGRYFKVPLATAGYAITVAW
jgi:hypothetical protein